MKRAGTFDIILSAASGLNFTQAPTFAPPSTSVTIPLGITYPVTSLTISVTAKEGFSSVLAITRIRRNLDV